MVYLTDEIDDGATQRRLDEITTAGMRALDEHAERSAQIDEEFRQAQAKMAEEAKAMDQLVADSHAKQEAAADGKDDQQAAPNVWAKREAKSTVLEFFGEEHTEEPRATAPPTTPGPLPSPEAALPVPVPPPMPAMPDSASKVMSLGYEEDEPEPEPQQRPSAARHSAPRPAHIEDDDDLSNVNWMR